LFDAPSGSVTTQIEVATMPEVGRFPHASRKIRDLLKDLRKAGFILVDGGKGSHRKFQGKAGKVAMIIPGRDGDDAQPYFERQVQEKIKESQQ
jgi:predicted RNA binding protein YcfA (HicA-like mRNA interferase family)